LLLPVPLLLPAPLLLPVPLLLPAPLLLQLHGPQQDPDSEAHRHGAAVHALPCHPVGAVCAPNGG
jgi:poly(3-hydroxybutyrate) depolymerase